MKAKDLQPGDYFRLNKEDDLKLCITVSPLPADSDDPLCNDGGIIVMYPIHQDITLSPEQDIQIIRLQL